MHLPFGFHPLREELRGRRKQRLLTQRGGRFTMHLALTHRPVCSPREAAAVRFFQMRLTPFLSDGFGRQWAPGWIRCNKEWIMTLDDIKAVAKRLARARRIQHIVALEHVAVALGQTHWRGLTEAHKQGWRPSAEQLKGLKCLFMAGAPPINGVMASSDIESVYGVMGDSLTFTRWVPEDVSPLDAEQLYGTLNGEAFCLLGDEFEVAIAGRGWEITVDQAPWATPVVRVTDRRIKAMPVTNEAFRARAIQILEIRARRMHAEVAADWPRRSTMPDYKGRVKHPLSGGVAAHWYCLHCDNRQEGRSLALNLWHCPDCRASPIDIYIKPFWRGDIPPA
ncbi:hypothetical protein [Mesorhizobium sp. M1348]|uniref:hypothetical protein n=1 Tax=unclassified Mesorhizobium TaxID=325217 RepID=UPI003339E5A4